MALTDELKQADKLKAELNKLLPMSIENEKRWWEKVRLDWNYNSNHIEGNTLTYGETKLLLIFDKTTGDHDLREFEEMKAHDVAIRLVTEWSKDNKRDLTERDIRELNKIILVKNYWKDAITSTGQPTQKEVKVGEYKETPNSVRLKTGGEFEFASPTDTPIKMAELLQWYRAEKSLHPLVLASKFHYDFIRIHPFDDGNGRVARLIVNYLLMKNSFPPLIIKSEEREKYITALNKADVGDIDAFHEYMADQLIYALELAIKAAKGESIEESNDAEKEVSLWKRELAKNETDVVIKSDDIIYRLYTISIKRLFSSYVEKMKVFNDLFTETEVIGHINSQNLGKGGIEFIDDEFNAWKAGLSKTNNKFLSRFPPGSLNDISVAIYFKYFNKDGKNAFTLSQFLNINFQATLYIISFNNEKLKEFLYSESMDESTITWIINTCIRETKNQIESHTKKNANKK